MQAHGAVLDDRIGQETAAQVVDIGAGGGLVVRLDGESDGLPDPDAGHAEEAERGQRTFDRLALGVGDALTQ